MVRFDSAQAGTPVAEWLADARLDALPSLAMQSNSAVIVLAAHPDDETLGAGGLIAEYSARGVPVRVVVVTDGGASHASSADRSTEQLVADRRAEAVAAIAVLAPNAILDFLEIPDGAVREHRREATALVRSILAQHREAATHAPVTLVAPWRGDGHRDHRIVGEIAAEIVAELVAEFGAGSAELLEYPIWMWHWATPTTDAVDWDALVQLSLSEAASAAKQRAIGEYRSQTQGDPPLLRADFLGHFDRATEIYFRQRDLLQAVRTE